MALKQPRSFDNSLSRKTRCVTVRRWISMASGAAQSNYFESRSSSPGFMLVIPSVVALCIFKLHSPAELFMLFVASCCSTLRDASPRPRVAASLRVGPGNRQCHPPGHPPNLPTRPPTTPPLAGKRGTSLALCISQFRMYREKQTCYFIWIKCINSSRRVNTHTCGICLNFVKIFFLN